MSVTEDILQNFGDNVTRLAKINLGRSRTVNGKRRVIDNSGKLRKSLKAEIKRSNDKITLVFSMEDYGVVVDGGRKKGKGAPIKEIKAWIKSKPIRLRDLKTGSFIKATESRINGLAFVINRKIKEKGIAPTNFLSDPFDKELIKIPEELQRALLSDIVEVLQMSLDNLNKK